jgi:hypothetical protein
MANEPEGELQPYLQAIEQVTADLKDYYPKAVLLFGSLARRLAGQVTDRLPNDMDVMIVCNSRPFAVEKKNYGIPVELNRMTVEQVVNIARSLRYDSKAVALSKLYSKNVLKQHSIDVIVACMMLGPTYNDFGIEQIDIGSAIDTRDYSVHRVFFGEQWWQRLRRYASERRGPWKRFVDRMVQDDRFDPDAKP